MKMYTFHEIDTTQNAAIISMEYDESSKNKHLYGTLGAL